MMESGNKVVTNKIQKSVRNTMVIHGESQEFSSAMAGNRMSRQASNDDVPTKLGQINLDGSMSFKDIRNIAVQSVGRKDVSTNNYEEEKRRSI